MIYQNIWNFLRENPFSALTVHNLKAFSNSQLYDDLYDQDLPKLLIKQLANHIENYLSNNKNDMDIKDALFDLFLSVSDFYQDKKETLKTIELEMLKSPTLLRDFYMYTENSIFLILKRLKIEKINICQSALPFIGNIDLPSCLTPIILKGLSGYFIYLFLHSLNEEDLMMRFNEKLEYIYLT